ncbi:MAG: hypothetical protein CBC48_21725 [bacterium TMED88]|nr:hypothetical protein [Deltaproteobacteria bacterium]OUV19455.1 MAG: hypothetical protein CBC48_21725 [bacterium TMED88]
MCALQAEKKIVARILILCAMVLGCQPSQEAGGQTPDGDRARLPLVVVIALDGVRPEEAFGPIASNPSPFDVGQNAPVMPYLTRQLPQTGFMFGAPEDGPALTLANPMGISMPGYHSMFMGRATFCVSNECSPPYGQNFFERVQEYHSLPDEAVAIYTSWKALCPALNPSEAFDGHCGQDAVDQQWRAFFESGLDGAKWSPPKEPDDAIFEIAMERLQAPTFQVLFLAFDGSDATGHANDYPGHIETLKKFDRWIQAIDEQLRKLEQGGQPTVLLVTTDHGRGEGELWSEHRWNVPGTGKLWLFVRGPEGLEAKRQPFGDPLTVATVRPTLEVLMQVPHVSGWPYERPAITIQENQTQSPPLGK